MLADLEREQIRRHGLGAFLKYAWEQFDPNPFRGGPHLDVMVAHCEAMTWNAIQGLKFEHQPWMDKYRDLPRLPECCLSVPPGSSKSSLVSVGWPAWIWTFAPKCRFICTSYSESLALRDGQKHRDLCLTDWYTQRWPHVSIEAGERASAGYFLNAHKGSRFSVPLGGAVTGRHADILIGDDPVRPADLFGPSTTELLEKTADRWLNVFSSRSANPKSFSKMIIAQRIHEKDLTAVVKELGAVECVLPMEFDPTRKYVSPWGSDWRTQPGELLIPDRFPPEVIEQRRKIMSARDFAAQMQQLPRPDGGLIFQKEWFETRYPFGTHPWGQAPITISVDASNKETKDSDFVVIQAWSKTQSRYFLVDEIRARMGFADTVKAIQTMRTRYANCRNILIEEKANGPAIIQTLQKQFPGVIAVNPQGGKESRAKASEWLWNSQAVVLPQGAPFLDAYIDEHLSFPHGSHDDRVDCTSQYLNWASSKDRAQLFKAAMSHQAKNLRVGRSPF